MAPPQPCELILTNDFQLLAAENIPWTHELQLLSVPLGPLMHHPFAFNAWHRLLSPKEAS
jgi:hypothetical protein